MTHQAVHLVELETHDELEFYCEPTFVAPGPPRYSHSVSEATCIDCLEEAKNWAENLLLLTTKRLKELSGKP